MQPLACLDVHYEEDRARIGCLLFRNWEDAEEESQHVFTRTGVAEYESGQFYKRELPCLLEALQGLSALPRTVVIDGYVWLDGESKRPGLGARLYASLQGVVPVVGVAKNPLDSSRGLTVERGDSKNPLYVTAAGLPPKRAAEWVASMHGPHRIPTLLKRVDQLARGTL